MSTTIQKADRILDKVLLGCIYTLCGIGVLLVLGTIGYAIYLNLSDFAIGALKFIGVIAALVVTVALCIKFIVVKLVTKTVLAILGVAAVAYILYGMITALIWG